MDAAGRAHSAMLDLLLLLATEPPSVTLREEAPPVVDWPTDWPVLRGDDARDLAASLEVDDPDEILSAEPHIGHYGQLERVTFHRRPSQTNSPLLCDPNWTGLSIRGSTSPDYPGWFSAEEAARLRAEDQIVDGPTIFHAIPLDAGEACERVDSADRVAAAFAEADLTRAVGLLNVLRRGVALGDFDAPICGPAPCDRRVLLETLTPSQVESVYQQSRQGPDCWRILFRTSAGPHGRWTMYLCGGDPGAARVSSEPTFG